MLFDESAIEQQHRALVSTSPGADLIVAAGLAVDLIRKINLSLAAESSDVLVVSTLGVRLTNSIGATFKLMGAGYFAPAIHQLRDIAETAILLEYFQRNPETISVWKQAEGKARLNKFKPGNLSNILSKRSNEAIEWYTRFCRYSELGTHPSTMGILSISTDSDLHVDPHFDARNFSAILWEISLDSCEAADAFIRAISSVATADLAGKFIGEVELLSRSREHVRMLRQEDCNRGA